MIALLKTILERGRNFDLPNEKQFTSIKRYRCITPITAQLRKGFGWVPVKL